MAERIPHADRSALAGPLALLTRAAVARPGAVLAAGLALAALCVAYTASSLALKTSRLDLLNPRSAYNQRWLAFLREFGSRDDAVVVVHSTQPARLAECLDDLAQQLTAETQHFASVLHRRDFSALRGKGLHFLPLAELQQLDRQLAQAFPGGALADPAAPLRSLNDAAEKIDLRQPQARAQFEQQYAHWAAGALGLFASADSETEPPPAEHAEPRHAADDLSARLAALDQLQPQRLLADDGRLGFVLLRLREDENEFTPAGRAIERLRAILAEARARRPEVWIGLTGMPIIEHDEMQASQADSVATSLVSLAGVLALFAAGYGGWRHGLLASATLLVGMAWTFGYITLCVGHLNILSAAFSVILIGLGIDFSIHYVASYLRLREAGLACDEALVRTARDVGPGVVTGGVTTAAAFFTAGLTEFVGIAELGIVAGGGVLLCLLATIVFLPPLIALVDGGQAAPLPRILPTAWWTAPLLQRPRTVALAAAAAMVLGAWGLGALEYDHNLLNLQPRHLESAAIERELLSRLDDNVWHAVTMCGSREETLRLKARFEQLPTVAKTEEIASLLPESGPEKSRLIARLQDRLSAAARPWPGAESSLAALERELARAAQQVTAEGTAARLLAQLRGAVAQAPAEQIGARLAALQQRARAPLARLAEALLPLADPAPPQLADLPRPLVDRFLGQQQQYLLKVYPRGFVWDMDRLEKFVADVESVAPEITGHPIQTYYASRHMQESYLEAGLYALVAVIALLYLDFRCWRHTLLAMVPLALASVQMLGLLGWLGIPLNPANMIVLPLILGIGVDDGVHLVHEMRRCRGPFQLGDSTALALILTSTTTMVSFGTMIGARHQGLCSLGQALTLGVLACWGMSFFVFPALLRWLTRDRSPAHDETPASPPPIRQTDPEPADEHAAWEPSPAQPRRRRLPRRADAAA